MTKDPGKTSTLVDLGDDLLLEDTRVLGGEDPRGPALSKPNATADERVRDAEILVREGMLEDAKKILHSVILERESNVAARQLLERVHDLELKQLFADDSGGPGRGRARPAPTRESAQVDQVIRQLDADLRLSLEPPELSLFRDVVFTADSADLRDIAPSDKMDLGIAFLEMGLHEQAIAFLEGACQDLMQGKGKGGAEAGAETGAQPLIEATGLLASALLAAGRAMDATLTLEPILRDTEVEHAAKLDLLYLMARAHEALGMHEPARQWYRQTLQLDPKYRDVEERLRKSTLS